MLEDVLLGRVPHRPALSFESEEDVRLARRALEDAGAAELAQRSVATLSGGERRRVLIARALCQGGPVLLADEPTAHLDVAAGIAVFELLARLARAGRAVVVVTHDLDLAAQAADRVVLLGRRGGSPSRVVAQGTPQDALTSTSLTNAFGCPIDVVLTADGVPRAPPPHRPRCGIGDLICTLLHHPFIRW